MDLIPALQSRGHDVTVLASYTGPGLPAFAKVGSVPVYRFDTWSALSTKDLKSLMSVRKAISSFKRELNPDIIHLHFGATAYLHLQTQSAVQPPTLTTVHALPESSLKENSVFSKVAHASQAVNAVSSKGKQLLSQAFPDLVDRFSFVYYGLGSAWQDATRIDPPSFGEPVILCLGRLVQQKGFDIALKAFARIVPAFPKAHLQIVGEGVEEAALKQLAATLGISHQVRFVGSVPPHAVREVLNQASMVLLPSRYEGLPLVALEAARMQRPIISSDVDGLPELVRDQESGLVLAENNEHELAKAILYLLQNPEQAIRMGKAAAQHLEEHFTFEHCVSEYERLFQKIA